MTVSALLEQASNRSDSPIKLVISCYQLVPDLFQQLGTSSTNTTCQRLVNRLVCRSVTTCFFVRVCYHACINQIRRTVSLPGDRAEAYQR